MAAGACMLVSDHGPNVEATDGAAATFALADGAAGGIFALSNAFPREMRAIIDAFVAGRPADDAQRRAAAITEAIKPYGAIPALKGLLPALADLPATSPRAPQVQIAPADAEALLARILSGCEGLLAGAA